MRRSAVTLYLLLFSSLFLHASQEKLIALTFDDGPRPYVLFGMPAGSEKPSTGLLQVLDQNNVKATFFVMGWRLTANSYGDRREFKTDKTCFQAAQEVAKRGHEIENHTFSHVQLKLLEKQRGEPGALADVNKGAHLIQGVTGRESHYLRPPDWIMPADLDQDLRSHGVRVLTISSENPLSIRDVNSLDYLCAGKGDQCPQPSLNESVLKQIDAREKHGVTTHILVFHELSTTVPVIQTLIPELKARGYRFVTLDQYMQSVDGGKFEAGK